MSSDDESTKGPEEEVNYDDISNPDILTKYRLAADIANLSLRGVLTQVVEGKDIAEICTFGDSLITKQTAKSFKSKKIEKGVAFPTCISVNDCVCNFSPLTGESRALKTGDVVKIDLGCHIDGYIATVAHTVVVGGEATGRTADAVVAAHTALQAAFKLATPGTKGSAVTAAVTEIAKSFGVSGLVGTLSHQMKRFSIDSGKSIAQIQDVDTKIEECDIEEGDVFQFDVCMTTGEGKMRIGEERCTVFKREVDTTYRLKMKASRHFIAEVNKNFSAMPFTLRAITDQTQARMGVVECQRHNLLEAYKVMYERSGGVVARFKATVIVGKNGTSKITGLDLPEGVTSEFSNSLSDDIKAILARSSKKKKKRGKKKKKAAAAPASE